ncbi:hypothetical protein R6Q59_026885 [Mikania micrantha]|uniref:Membrane protein of ER body-like protein n=1 Tax=Mikania micrantha TaxID=192012 RepID=A0A5N6ME66_9ASTR|nr:hypothetical protein E3N88_33942 [Mikania micrantha]
MEIAINHDTRSSDDGSSFGSEVDTDVEDTAEARLITRKPRRQLFGTGAVPGLTKASNDDGEPSENTAYLDKYGGAIEDLNIQKLLNVVQYDANGNEATKPAINDGGEAIKAKSDKIVEEIMEEEVVELEFENAIPKLHTHTMHCPNCDHHITKVVLRRKIIKCRPPIAEEQHEPVDLLGCFSCFSLFTFSGNGGFNTFPIFGKKPTSSAVLRADGNDVVREDGNCFSIFRIFRREKDSKQLKHEEPEQESNQTKPEKIDQDYEQPKQIDQESKEPIPDPSPPVREFTYVLNKLPIRQGDRDSEQPTKIDQDSKEPKPENFDQSSPPITEMNFVLNKLPIRQGENYGPNVNVEPSKLENQLSASDVPSHYDQLHLGVRPRDDHESSIDILPDTSSEIQARAPESAGQDSTSFEILKSIVYGGLMEVIASLSIVASAAAGDATTLNIIALALANLIGGVFLISHNLWDLKDDCYKYSTQETSNQESRNKYKELLGSVEHFPLHAFFAILSFLVFGLIPPVTYGYTFHETNDNDFTMVIVAVASFVCVGLLAIFKAYIDKCTGFSGYVKTIMYYLTTVVAVSGVSYAAGNLVKRLIEELGLFESSSNVAIAVLPEAMPTNPSLAYY